MTLNRVSLLSHRHAIGVVGTRAARLLVHPQVSVLVEVTLVDSIIWLIGAMASTVLCITAPLQGLSPSLNEDDDHDVFRELRH